MEHPPWPASPHNGPQLPQTAALHGYLPPPCTPLPPSTGGPARWRGWEGLALVLTNAETQRGVATHGLKCLVLSGMAAGSPGFPRWGPAWRRQAQQGCSGPHWFGGGNPRSLPWACRMSSRLPTCARRPSPGGLTPLPPAVSVPVPAGWRGLGIDSLITRSHCHRSVLGALLRRPLLSCLSGF